MNKKFITLTKILLKSGLGTQGKRNKSGKTGILDRKLVLYLIIALALLPLVASIITMTVSIYDVLAQIGQHGVIISLSIIAISFMMFFFGIIYVMNVFYFSSDIERLLPLPLKPSQILAAKFLTVVFYEYLTEMIILFPILIAYGVKSGEGIAFYLISLVIFLLVPVIPLTMASIIVMIIMRFTNIGRHKDLFKVIGGIIGIAFGLGINIVIQNAVNKSLDPKALQDMLLSGGNSFVGIIGRMFPGAEFAANSLANSANINGLVNFIIFVAITVVGFLIFVYLGEMIYFKGVIGLSESGGSKSTGIEDLRKKSIRNSKLRSYLGKEVKLLIRTPIYFLNCVLTNFMWPVIFLIMPMAQSAGSNDMNLDMLRSIIANNEHAGVILSAAVAAAVFIAGANGITATCISREGQQLYINKYLPISYTDQLHAKVLSGIIFSTIGMVGLIATATVLLRIDTVIVILSLIAGFIAIFFTSLTGILIDLYNPKLNWDNEQKAVKQNMNVVINMLISMALGFLTVFGIVNLKTDLYTTFAILVLVFGILDVLLYRLLDYKGAEVFSRIE